MTAIPAALVADTDEKAIALTLERLSGHALTPLEAEKDLLLFFDAEVSTDNKGQLLRYLSAMARQVERGELSAEDAASDIKEMIGFWLSRSEDLQHLLDLGTE